MILIFYKNFAWTQKFLCVTLRSLVSCKELYSSYEKVKQRKEQLFWTVSMVLIDESMTLAFKLANLR